MIKQQDGQDIIRLRNSSEGMTQLKDLCLQVFSEGDPNSLHDIFFGPVSSAAIQYRARVVSLNHGSLLPISLGLSKFLSSGKKVQLLISSAAFSPDAQKMQFASLAYIDNESKCRLLTLAEHFAVRLTADPLPNVVPTTEVSTTATIGYFTDETGASVSYQTDWSDIPANPHTPILEASWTWGDPKFRVRTAIEKFETLWSNNTTQVLPDDNRFALLSTLLQIEQNPILQQDSQTKIKLYQHQQKAIDMWASHEFKGIFEMCTGAGKTISALAGVGVLAEHRRQSSKRIPAVIVSVPTRVLADQWIREIGQFGYKSIIGAYNAFENWSQLLIPTLKHQNQPRFIVTTYRTFSDERFIARLKQASTTGIEALWIADEMHNLASPRLRNTMHQVGDLFSFRLGLSATPEIEGDLTATEQLLSFFGNVCASYELNDGIRDGVLCPYRYHPIPAYLAPDRGEQYLSLLQKIDNPKVGSSALMNLYREARDLVRTSGVQVARFRDLLKSLLQTLPDLRHTLIYCPPGYGNSEGETSDEIDTDLGERRLIEEIIEILRENGLSTSSILGETPADQRTQILSRFAAGKINTLCAIGCLDEGVDVPSIQRAIVLYSIDRSKQFIQRRGRILRQIKGVGGKIAEIYDIVILPQGSVMPTIQSEALLSRELRRYREFAKLALNRESADLEISNALSVATQGVNDPPKQEIKYAE